LIQGAAESNQWVESAECSTSYAIADRQYESDHEMSLDITSVISESEYWENIMQFLDS